MKYRKKAVVIEAIQWDGTFFGTQAIKSEFDTLSTVCMDYNIDRDEVSRWKIGTFEGSHVVSKDDYIIKGINGEFYLCKPEIFAKTYEKVEE